MFWKYIKYLINKKNFMYYSCCKNKNKYLENDKNICNSKYSYSYCFVTFYLLYLDHGM